MNVFENLIDRIQRKLAFGSTKQKTFMHHAKTLLKGEDIDLEIIWRGLEGAEGQQNAQLYCQLIFNDFYSGEIKQKKNSMYEEQILATLLPLRFYKVKWDKKFGLNEQTVKQSRVAAHSKWIISFFNENQKWNFFSIINRFVFAPVHIQSSSYEAEEIISQMKQCQQYCKMVRQRKQIQVHNFKKLKRVSYPKSCELESRALTYGYVCLIDYIKDRNSSLTYEQFNHLKNLLSFYLYSNENKIMECLPILLHLLKSFITFYGCPYEKILKQFLLISNQIRAMPEDIGRVGEQLFHRLLKELKLPGYSFRRRLVQSLPDLSCKQSLFSIKQHYFITNSISFVNQGDKINLSALRKKIIFHLLKVSGFSLKQLNMTQQYLSDLKDGELLHIYSKAMKVCEVSYEVQSFQQAKNILKESLEKLMIFETKPTENRKKFKAEQSLLKAIDKKNKRQHPLCLFQFPSIPIAHIPLSQFLESKSNNNLQALIKKMKGQLPIKTYFASKWKLSLIFYGNTLQFFKFMQPLGRYLQYRSVDKLTGFKIYYIPKKNKFRQNYLSDYLGCFDLLYQRTIINCFGERAIYPWVEPKQNNRNLLPIQLMSKNLNCYLNDGENTFHINLFKCTVGKIGLNYNKFEESYYFCESVNIGLFAEAEILKMNKFLESNKQKYNLRELPDIISLKLKQYEPLAVLIQMQKYEKFQNKTSFHKQKMIMVEDIQICNLPKSYFLGKKPKPNSSSLEVSILPSSNGKLFRKELTNSYNFKQKRQNYQIVEAFKDLFIECTVKSIRIQNLKKQTGMKIVIDGQVMEGIDHIQIQAAISIDKRILTLPIQTFLSIK